jgi:PAS domain S-box-containing protein
MTKKKSVKKSGRPGAASAKAVRPVTSKAGTAQGELARLRASVRRLEGALRAAEALLDIGPAFVGFLSLEGRVTVCNNLALVVIEASQEDVFGQLFWEAPWWRALPASAARVRDAVKAAALGGASNFDVEYWAIQEGVGRPRWVALAITPMKDARGRVLRIAATGIDITERREGQEALRRSEDHLRVAVDTSERTKEELLNSEEHLRRIVDVTQVGAWELDLVTGVLVADARFNALFGLAPGEAFPLSKRLALIHPEDRQRVDDALSGAISGKDGGRYSAEYRTSRLIDGRPQWVEARGQVRFGPDGEAVRFLGTGSDITARKEAEAALRAENERRRTLEALAEASEDLIAFASPDGQLLYVNPAGRRIVGLGGMEEACGKKLADYFTPEARRVALEEAIPQLLAGLGWSGETTLRHFQTGEAIPMHQVGMGLFGEEGKLVRMAVIMRDLRALKRQFEQERQRADFERQLIGMVSHDLRNPLNAILLSAAVLGHQQGLNEDTAKFVVRIQSTAQRAGRMIRDLLDFTQARLSGGIPVSRRAVDLREVVQTALDEVQAAHPGKRMETAHEGDVRGEWDSDRLIQVVENLVSNAVTYGLPATPVRIATRADAESVTLSVNNEGPPIPEEKLAGIFEPLQRATDTVDKASRSVGLGLYIVKQLVNAHGGTVWATSSLAEGTTFTVRLPRTSVGPSGVPASLSDAVRR